MMNLRPRHFPCLILISIALPLNAGCTTTKDLGAGGTEASTQNATTTATTTGGGHDSMSATSGASVTGGGTASTGESSDSGPTATQAGSTTTAVDGTTGETVDCDPFPTEGTPCETEGASCSTDCADPCEFCNIMQCESGAWSHIEVLPADCLSCSGVCEQALEPACAAGPPDAEACLTGCEETANGDCSLVFSQMLACIGARSTFTCNETAQPEVAGCERAFDELYACMAR